ncbi:MAG: baseplate J/gp47 family protein [Candidatus Nanopelagicaceae bacterium]|nr:baseplate J/gp47 family protein [Candidatus Nanopelagicaceae bacterium]
MTTTALQEVQSYFNLPNRPEELGVLLPSPELRKIDFSALDFSTLQRGLIEYLTTYYQLTHNDFVPHNGIMMLIDLLAYVGATLSLRSDVIADESFLPTAQTSEAVINHLALIGQRILRPTPAVVDVQVSVDAPVQSEIRVPAGIKFSLKGTDGNPLVYELYRAPGDFTNQLIIPPGKRGVIGWAVEGSFQTPVTATSAGGSGQTIEVFNTGILDEPIFVDVKSGSITNRWRRVEHLELSNATDEVYEIKFYENRMTVVFGDDVHGEAPLAGQEVTVNYRTGGGRRGRIGSLAIRESRPISPQPPFTATIEVVFSNPTASSGGTDGETLAEAKDRAPRNFNTHDNAVSAEDYSFLSSQFKHPVYGAVLKAAAIVRTSLNANVVEINALAAGPNDVPVKPSAGLKKGLKTFLEERNVLTDEVRVLDGEIRPIDVVANVVMDRNADAGTVKEKVNTVIDDFFAVSQFDIGQGFYISQLFSAVQSVDGVSFVDIFNPIDDVLSIEEAGSGGGVAYNELITLGKKEVRFYFEKPIR